MSTPRIVRVDRYTIEVDGFQVRATEDQESRLRLMTPEQVKNFVAIMGCRCQITGWTRDPAEPHIPARPEWEQADDCPVHPLRRVSGDVGVDVAAALEAHQAKCAHPGCPTNNGDETYPPYCPPCSEKIGEWVRHDGHLADVLAPLIAAREQAAVCGYIETKEVPRIAVDFATPESKWLLDSLVKTALRGVADELEMHAVGSICRSCGADNYAPVTFACDFIRERAG